MKGMIDMAQKITNYTKFVTKDEKDLYNNLSKTIGSSDMVDFVYDEIIRQKNKDSDGFGSIYGQSQNISGERCTSFDKNILADLLANNHQRNFDTKLQGSGTNEIITRDESVEKIVSFRLADSEVAYIDKNGAFVGNIGEYTTDEIYSAIKNGITEIEVRGMLSKKVDKIYLFDTNGMIKKALIPEIIPQEVTDHIVNTEVHVTTEDKTRWDSKYDLPENGIPKADLSEEVIQFISDAPDKLLTGAGHIKENYLNFTVIAKKSDINEKAEELTRTFMAEIEAIKERLADNNILVNDNVIVSGNEITLSHQDILVTEDFEFTVNGIEYFIDTDFELDTQSGTINWTNPHFDLDNSMKVMVQYSVKKSK